MDTTRIKAFLLAVKYGSFSKAAEELSYTPSALSHIADAIELEVGLKILKRTYSGISLTEDGKIIYEKLNNIVDAENNLFKAVETLKCDDNKLIIGAYSSISKYLLPDIIKKFKTAYPKTQVSIKVANDLRDMLSGGKADVVFADTKLEHASFVSIMTDPFVAIVPHDLFPHRKCVEREELYGLPYISHSESVLRKYFDENKFKEIIKFDSVDDESIISMVKEKIGIAVLPFLTVNNEKSVKILKLKPELSRNLGFIYKNDNYQKSTVIKFINFITKEYLSNSRR